MTQLAPGATWLAQLFVSVKLGEPDAKLFEIPADAEEMKPTAAQRRSLEDLTHALHMTLADDEFEQIVNQAAKDDVAYGAGPK